MFSDAPHGAARQDCATIAEDNLREIGCEFLYVIGDAILIDTTLATLVKRFLPPCDLYYFEAEHIHRYLIEAGIPVYTREEFSRSFPRFSLDYGAVYHMFDLAIPEVPWVTLLHASEWRSISRELQAELMVSQIRCGRGSVYCADWFGNADRPANNTVTVDGRWFYGLTAGDWQAKGVAEQKLWVLKWLRKWHQDDGPAVGGELNGGFERVPYGLIHEYAGRFADQSGPNCFAAAIGMVLGGTGVASYPQSRRLMTQWLHQAPFFRLLDAQRYERVTEVRTIAHTSAVQPTDVLVWCTSDGTAQHAAFAVAPDTVFQKGGQGWESPWQLVRLEDVWYNESLQSGGYIALYRQQ